MAVGSNGGYGGFYCLALRAVKPAPRRSSGKARGAGTLVLVPWLALWLALLAAVACSSSGSPGSPGPSGSRGRVRRRLSPEAAPMPAANPEAVIGSFDIRLVPADPGLAGSAPNPAYVAVQGRVASAPEPTAADPGGEGARGFLPDRGALGPLLRVLP